jgi:hypothetical protein
MYICTCAIDTITGKIKHLELWLPWRLLQCWSWSLSPWRWPHGCGQWRCNTWCGVPTPSRDRSAGKGSAGQLTGSSSATTRSPRRCVWRRPTTCWTSAPTTSSRACCRSTRRGLRRTARCSCRGWATGRRSASPTTTWRSRSCPTRPGSTARRTRGPTSWPC